MIMTIIEAIKRVLKDNSTGLTSKEIYEKIVENNYYTFKAKDPKSIVNGIIRKHCYGLDFPTANPKKHFAKVNKTRGKCRYVILSSLSQNTVNTNHVEVTKTTPSNDGCLPEENLEKYYAQHIKYLKTQLMEMILDAKPDFFEKLVVDLLLKMGYGYDECSGTVTQYSHDGGVDGIIEEDKLGLDKIYIQAKRYSVNNTVSTADVNQFAAVMGKHGVKKGVFITTSSFSKKALEDYSKPVDSKVIKLIDGEMLMDYLVKYEIGVESVKFYKTFQIKSDYFM